MSVWICFVVGAHFVPLAIILRDPGLHVLAISVTAVAGAVAGLARRSRLHPSALVGTGVGIVLLLFAARALLAVITTM